MKIIYFAIFVVLVKLSDQLPMKGSASTQIDPNEHSSSDDNPITHQENVLGKFCDSSSITTSSLIIHSLTQSMNDT